ncbi:MAG TPA: CopG family antitoxin [Bryobacteraceae bacterium]|nr:CopG family antitoxin [Bryobacteraceae bacterium]
MKSSRSSKRANLANGELVLPEWKSEAEEAKWWYDNRDLVFEHLSKRARLVQPDAAERTRSVTLRIPESDLARAKSIAQRSGKPYQRVLKDAMRDGLKRAG